MTTTIYYHKHHIIPKSLGGTNKKSNIVKLTISGHIAVHKWMYETYGRWQDKVAYLGMSGIIGKEEILHLICCNACKGREPWNKDKTYEELYGDKSEEIKKKVVHKGENHGMYGKIHTNEARKRMGNRTPRTDEQKEYIRQANLGKKVSQQTRNLLSEKARNITNETRKKRSIALSGENNGMYGKPSWNKGIKQPIAACPHCGKTGGERSMKPYHFDNCKQKT